jgi:hypothetical protein
VGCHPSLGSLHCVCLQVCILQLALACLECAGDQGFQPSLQKQPSLVDDW